MDLELDDGQRLLIDSFTGLLSKEATPAHVRAAEPLGFDAQLWEALGEIGAVPMAVPEAHGGWGASLLDLTLVTEVIGRHCAPAPVVESQVAARLLARLGASELTEVIEEGAVASLALHPVRDGAARFVPAGAVAALVVGIDGDRLLLRRAAVRAAQVPNHANLPVADLTFDGASALTTGPEAQAAFDAATDDWLLLTASALVGIGARALEIAVEYAGERRAFGVPIGSFQGIAHRLADVATAIDGARLLVQEAAWSCDASLPEGSERSAMAFGFATDAARHATYWSVHTLGGYGVMVEYDPQLYFRRARGWAGVFGDADAAYRRVADRRYGPLEVGA